jgi:hypothetical protein
MIMAAVTPRAIVNRFRSYLALGEQNYDTMVAAIPAGQPRKAMQGTLSEQFALELGVRWEGFIHDLFIGHLMKSKRSFFKTKKAGIKQSVRERYGEHWSKVVRIVSHGKWTPRLIESLIDPKQRNIAIASADKLYERARDLLGRKAIKFSLDPEDRKLIDFVIALRNCLAHQSKGARKELKLLVSGFTGQGPNAGLSGPLGKVAAYLRTTAGPGHHTRLKVVYARMSDISAKLV